MSLSIGIAASLFTAVFFTRLLFDLIYMGRRKRRGDLSHMIELFHNPNYDFIGRRRWAYLVSVALHR